MLRAVITPTTFLLFVFIALLGGSSKARAERYTYSEDGRWAIVRPVAKQPSLLESDSTVRIFGLTLLAGVPEGIAPGISIHPGTNIVHLDLSFSAQLAFGVRAGVTLDPLDWVVAPTLTLAGGYNGWATVPSTTTEYQLYYLNIQPGIEYGSRSRFRVFLRVGYSHFWLAGRYNQGFKGATAKDDASLGISLFPSLNLGLTAYFGP
jgi:hypothetical protein